MRKIKATIGALSVSAVLFAGCVGMHKAPEAQVQAAVEEEKPTVVIDNRPELTENEAALFTTAAWFANGGTVQQMDGKAWVPQDIALPAKPTLKVSVSGTGAGIYPTIQKAVNAACTSGTTDRVYIGVESGTWHGTVYIPSDAPPITLYGLGAKPEDTVIECAIDAMYSPAKWIETVNPSGQYVEGDPAWSMYIACAGLLDKKAAKVDTPCTPVLWVQNDGFELSHITVQNSLLDTVGADTHQAVALRTDGDRIRIQDVRLIARQDTLWANAGDPATVDNKQGAYSLTRIARFYMTDSYIEGDTDFVMGRAQAVFERCTFNVVTTRKPASPNPGIVFAPDTLPEMSYGFLVQNCDFTTDSGYEGSTTKAFLGRSWDQGTSSTGYIPGKSPDGQLVIRESRFSAHFNGETPWYRSAATSGRPYRGNPSSDRNLDDHTYNRLWLYKNSGEGFQR